MKKLIALTLATVMLFALCACGSGGEQTASDDGVNEPLTKDDVITIYVPSSSENPILDDWKLLEYMQEGSGATLDIISVPDTDATTKYPLLFAGGDTLPDLMVFQVINEHSKYAGEGLVAFEDLEEYMPTYNAWLEGLSKEKYDLVVKTRKRADGKIYYSPTTGREGKTRLRAWLYREDVFKKHNLKAPETFDELYEVSKQLKELYPDSYPFCPRNLGYLMNIPGSSFDKWWGYNAYYDHDDVEWRWGSIEDTAIEVASFYNKMVAEKLMPANFATINNSEWGELILTDRGFIMPHLQLKIDEFNQLAAGNNPEFKIQAFVPPVANPEKGVSMVERGDIEMNGISICDTGDAKRIANAAKFLDWMYTDEAMELLSWGKEGETYEVVNGKKQYITDEKNSSPSQLYGFTTRGSFVRLDPDALEATQSETTLESESILTEHTLPYYPVSEWLDFNNEEQAVLDMYITGLRTYTDEMMLKFILGQEPLSSFDTFVETVKEMGVEEVLKAYETAYNRVK